MTRRLMLILVLGMTLGAAGCGGDDDPAVTQAPTTAAAAAPTQAAETAPASPQATEAAAASGFTGVEGVDVAAAGEYDLPEDFPPEFPVPAGGDFELLDDTDTYVSIRLDYSGTADPEALLAFFEEGFPANGWEPTEQHSNKDQFGYNNENRQFSKDDLSATVTVWFPQESGDPYVVMDLFRA